MPKTFLGGLDIGGTKCAAILAEKRADGTAELLAESRFATAEFPVPEACLNELTDRLTMLLSRYGAGKEQLAGIGISCGGPLDAACGVILSPPNLPGWDEIPATAIVEARSGCSAALENDANACALAEWRFGAGRGTQNMLFLTFGTGLGAGLILDGRLYRGTNGNAGECGHVRLAPEGPVGYGKAGSFEGFCSGGGIARLGQAYARTRLQEGRPVAWGKDESAITAVTAKSLAIAADAGDEDARAIYAESGRKLGTGLAMLIDLFNPERIVIGSVFARSEALLRPAMEAVIAAEALAPAAAVCRVVPAALGEAIGSYGALAVAEMAVRP